MGTRTRRGNRLGLMITGLVLVLAGAALLALQQGWLGHDLPHHALYPIEARRFVHANHSWLWPVAAIVAVVIGLIYLRWLLVQTRSEHLRDIVIDSDDGLEDATGLTSAQASDAADRSGRTSLPAAAITDMVEEDLVTVRGVRSAYARLSGHVDAPQLWLRITTDSNADLGAIRRRVIDHVVTDVRASLELPHLPTYLRIVVSKRAGAREVR